MIIIDFDNEKFGFGGDIDTILAEISYLTFELLKLGVKYDLIQNAVKNGFNYYLKEEK